MNHDEFAFFNQQLGAMLRDGIPLEGALKQLATGMGVGPLRHEIQQLEAELARGTPLPEALAHRNLPDFYCRMVTIGARSNDLPAMLTLLADHYQQTHALWTRLKGLMVYPLIVILVALAFTVLLSIIFSRFLTSFLTDMGAVPGFLLACLWLPPLVLGLLGGLGLAAVSIPAWRARLRWWLPAFREASLAQLAAAMALMLRNHTTLADALALAEGLEADTPAAKVLARWRAQVVSGQGKPAQWALAASPFPPLFIWLVQKGGEDAAAGFEQAAEIYRTRAGYRIELALYGALPVTILFVGQMIFWQVAPLMRSFVWLMNVLGGPENQ